MLLASLLYTDGINTIIRMASVYAAEVGILDKHIILALLLVQIVAVPFSFLFARLAHWIGAKNSVLIAVAVYAIVTLLGYRMKTAADFYLLATLVGMVQGGGQALSRPMFASLVPRHRSSEFFGFWGVFEKFAGILGPALFAEAIRVTGSSRTAILSIVVFFVLGAVLLLTVDLKEGDRAAREAERGVHGARQPANPA